MLIKNIRFLQNYVIEVELFTKEIIYFNMKNYLDSARFCGITEQKIFEKGKLVDNSCIKWDNDTILYDYEILGREFIRKRLYHNF